eukprot:m51a1_g14842 Adaptor protein complex 1 (AP-1), mu subunit B (327) ;mRNA; f:1623480-1624548
MQRVAISCLPAALCAPAVAAAPQPQPSRGAAAAPAAAAPAPAPRYRADVPVAPLLQRRVASTALVQVTGAVCWRCDGVKYRRNELFVDLVERVRLRVSRTRQPVELRVDGVLSMRAQLSGMPELRVGLSRPVDALEDVAVCPFVRVGAAGDVLRLVPPDGEFEVMRYSASEGLRAPVWVERLEEVRQQAGACGGYACCVTLCTRFAGSGAVARNVVVRVPVPRGAHSPALQAELVAGEDAVVWTVKEVEAGKQLMLRIAVQVAQAAEEAEGPRGRVDEAVGVQFEVTGYTCSGLRLLYCKVVERSSYSTVMWPRCITLSGDPYSFD